MTHIEGAVNAFISRAFTSAAMANPMIPNTNLDARKALIDLFTLGPAVDEQKKREAQNPFDKTGALKEFRNTITQLRKQDEAVQVAINNARQDPRIGIPPGAENQSSSPCLGI